MRRLILTIALIIISALPTLAAYKPKTAATITVYGNGRIEWARTQERFRPVTGPVDIIDMIGQYATQGMRTTKRAVNPDAVAFIITIDTEGYVSGLLYGKANPMQKPDAMIKRIRHAGNLALYPTIFTGFDKAGVIDR